MSLILNFVYCFTGFIGRGADFTCLSCVCFKFMSKVVKYTCRLRQYDYTHDQLHTRHYIFFFGGGAQNLSLPPGASYPRYATEHGGLL